MVFFDDDDDDDDDDGLRVHVHVGIHELSSENFDSCLAHAKAEIHLFAHDK